MHILRLLGEKEREREYHTDLSLITANDIVRLLKCIIPGNNTNGDIGDDNINSKCHSNERGEHHIRKQLCLYLIRAILEMCLSELFHHLTMLPFRGHHYQKWLSDSLA